MSFKFGLRTYIGVPGTDTVADGHLIQGLVTSRRDSIGRENSYQLEWKDRRGNDAVMWMDESSIIAANAAKTPQRKAADLAKKLKRKR